jgi:hypothetical protein
VTAHRSAASENNDGKGRAAQAESGHEQTVSTTGPRDGTAISTKGHRQPTLTFDEVQGMDGAVQPGADYRIVGDLQIRLKLFPLREQLPNLPHECLVAAHDGLSGFVVVIEAWRGHGSLDGLDGLLALGDAMLEIGQAVAMRLLGPLVSASLGLGLLPRLLGFASTVALGLTARRFGRHR